MPSPTRSPRALVQLSAACAGVLAFGTVAGDVTLTPAGPGAASPATPSASARLAPTRLAPTRLAPTRLVPTRRETGAALTGRASLPTRPAARSGTLHPATRAASRSHDRSPLPRRRGALTRPRYVLPVAHYRLTAGFGDQGGLWSSGHTGQDFAAPAGTPVLAVEDAVVTSAAWAGAYGRRIELRHPDGTYTWYCHLSAFVVTGGSVRAGETIGRVGSSGNTTGPHLHLEVRVAGEPIDPIGWLHRYGLHP